jgi:hypothetical protein
MARTTQGIKIGPQAPKPPATHPASPKQPGTTESLPPGSPKRLPGNPPTGKAGVNTP